MPRIAVDRIDAGRDRTRVRAEMREPRAVHFIGIDERRPRAGLPFAMHGKTAIARMREVDPRRSIDRERILARKRAAREDAGVRRRFGRVVVDDQHVDRTVQTLQQRVEKRFFARAHDQMGGDAGRPRHQRPPSTARANTSRVSPAQRSQVNAAACTGPRAASAAA
jgi:hypothetical protein